MRLSGGEVAGEQDVGVALANGRGEAHGERGDREAALAFVGVLDVVAAGGIVEFLLGGVDEDRLVRHFAVIDLRPRELEARRLDLRRRVLDQQHGQAVGRDLADLGQHQAVAVRVDEVRVDPARAGIGKLADIELARGEQHLAQLAVDGVAVDVAVEESVVRAQRLDLGDGVVKSAPIPQPHVVEQVLVASDVDGELRDAL